MQIKQSRQSAAFALIASSVSANFASAQTEAELQANIAKLQAQISALSGTTPAATTSGSSMGGAMLTRNLAMGSTGEDVRQLQKILNSNPATRIAASGAGSPGMENTKFGPATMAAVKKFQKANGLPQVGNVGPATRAKLNAIAGASTGTPTTPVIGAPVVTPVFTSGDLTVSAGKQPADGYAIQGAQRVPYTTFNLTAGANDVTVTGVTVKKVGLASNSNFDSVSLLGANGTQVGGTKSLSTSDNTASVGGRFVVRAGTTVSLTVVANIYKNDTAKNETLFKSGGVAGFQITGVNTLGGMVAVTTPVSGATHVLSDAVVLGSITAKKNDTYSSTEKLNIGERKLVASYNLRVSGDDEGAIVKSLTFVQNGSISSSNLKTLKARIDGSDYDFSVNGDRFTVVTPNGITIEKNKNVDVEIFATVDGGIARTVQFTIDDKNDIYVVGSKYGYGLTVSLTPATSTNMVSSIYTVLGNKITASPEALVLSSDDTKPVLGTNQLIAASDKFQIAGEALTFKGGKFNLNINPKFADTATCQARQSGADAEMKITNVRLATSKGGDTVATAQNDIVITCQSLTAGNLIKDVVADFSKDTFDLNPGTYAWFVYGDIESDWKDTTEIINKDSTTNKAIAFASIRGVDSKESYSFDSLGDDINQV